MTIELLPAIEAGLSTLAAEQGLPLAQYARGLLEGQLPGHGQAMLSPIERATVRLDCVRGLPHTPPLSDKAISRESIYDARGCVFSSIPTWYCAGPSLTTQAMP